MINYLYQCLNFIYRKDLKDNPFKYFAIYTNQIENSLMDSGVKFPALLVQIQQMNTSYVGQRTNIAELRITFHIYTHSRGTIRNTSLIAEKTAKHYNLVQDVHNAYDGINFKEGIIPWNITDDALYYSFGTFDRYQIDEPKTYKNTLYTKASYRAKIFDRTNLRDSGLVEYEIDSISYDEISGYTNAVWSLNISKIHMDDFYEADFNDDFF